jgi:hypothetical protein
MWEGATLAIKRGYGGVPHDMPNSSRRQARYWIATIPRDDWEPCLPTDAQFLTGQPEIGAGGFRHHQVLVYYSQKKSLAQVKRSFGLSGMFVEPTRSRAAEEYVHKAETRDGEPYEFGQRSFQRNNSTDWDRIRDLAKQGRIGDVPSEVFIRYYRTLRTIAADHAQPVAMERTVRCFYGATGTGKTRRAWEEAGEHAYIKDPRSKFWCGYKGESNVIIDEFRGGIDIAHLLRWLDRYPVRVETKGASMPLSARSIWITSNLHPESWFPDVDAATRDALLRRMEIILIE